MKTFVISVCTGLIILTATMSENYVHSYANGAPAQVTGSPADGQTCAKSGCHTGNFVTATPGIITSNIPASGYVAGNVYTITATLNQTGNSCWGFEISPQDLSGAQMGTLIATNAATTKIVSSKYITHQNSGTSGMDSKSWSFDWIAPIAGMGTVTFYGAFNICNGNGTKTGDFIHTSTLTVNEFTSGFSEINAGDVLSVFPNPVREKAQISMYLKKPTSVKMYLSGMGEHPVLLCEEYNISGSYIYEFNRGKYKSGLYMVWLVTENGTSAQKILLL